MTSRRVLLCPLVLALAAVGCNAGKSYPATSPVRGVVTLDGAPVENADVELIPSGAGQPCMGVTGPDGSFAVETAFDSGKVYQPGAIPGEYRIAVRKLDIEGVKDFGRPPENLLPKKYDNPATSGFTVTVVAGAESTIDLPLKKK